MSARTTKATRNQNGSNHQSLRDTRKSRQRKARGAGSPPRASAVSLALCCLGLLGVLAVALAVTRLWRGEPEGTNATVSPTGGTTGVEPEERRLLEALDERPREFGPHLELAQFYLRRRRPAEAAWEYQEAALLRPAALPAQMGLDLALGQLRLHDLAIARLEELRRLHPGELDVRRALAEFYLVTGRPERGAAVLASALTAGRRRSSAEMFLALGRMRWALGEPVAARNAFQEAARAAPGSAEADLWLGRVARASGREAEARRLWERGAHRAPADPRFPYELGMLEARASAERAARAFDEALRRAPGYVPAMLQRGLAEERRGDPRGAAEWLLRSVKRAPSDPDAHAHLADALEALGARDEALRHRGLAFSLSDRPALALATYERLRMAHPDAPDVIQLVSQSYIQMQQNEQAARIVSEALRRHPEEPALYESLVALYVLTHSRGEAEQTCQSWLRVQPEAARPHWMLGRVLMGGSRPEEAVRQCEVALAREPNEPEYCFALGSALAQRPDRPAQRRGISLLRRAVAQEGSSAEYRSGLGAALLQEGQWEPARREFLAAVSLDPTELRAYNGLAQVSQGLQRPHQVALWAAAMRVMQDRLREEKFQRRAAGQRPRDASAYYSLARSLLRAGEVAKAQSQVEQSVQLRSNWLEARQLLARITALRDAL
jgi:tetratricopeptide (TPR) repeat protein